MRIQLQLELTQARTHRRFVWFQAVILALVIALTLGTSRLRADTGTCSGATVMLPFTDVMGNPFFCFIAEVYFLGITSGTTPTTYGPNDPVTRGQMAAFLDRTHDSAVKRASRRIIYNRPWMTTPQYEVTAGSGTLGTTAVGDTPEQVAFDGADLWVANNGSGTVSRVRASDGKTLEDWTGATGALGVLVAMGRVFVAGQLSPNGKLYMIDPSQPFGMVTTLSSNLGDGPAGIAFDGARIWVTNQVSNSVSIITPGSPFTVTNVGGFNQPKGILFDGANIWVTNHGNMQLLKLGASGNILQTVAVGISPDYPVFDGANIWVPNNSDSVTVVRAATGQVLATLTGNGLNLPMAATFDGERILVTNGNGLSVSLWKAADLTPLGSFSTGAQGVPHHACSDGLNFWITLGAVNKLARF